MLIIVVAGLTACGGAVFCVLDRPASRNKHRNAMLSGILLAVAAVAILAGLVFGIRGWLSS